MLWLTLGVILGFAWHWLLVWSGKRSLRISWLTWLLIILAVVAALSGAQNFVGLMEEYEEHAAWRMIPVYGIQTLIPAALALLLLRRGLKKDTSASAATRAVA